MVLFKSVKENYGLSFILDVLLTGDPLLGHGKEHGDNGFYFKHDTIES